LKTFAEFIEIDEYQEFLLCLEYVEKERLGILEDGLIDNLKGALKKKVDFIKEILSIVKGKVSDVIALLKIRSVFDFLKRINFDFKKLYKLLQRGFKAYRDLRKVIFEYIAETRVAKWTEKELKKLDEFLKKHPKTKKIAGLAIAGILLYIWLNMSFTGDFGFDMSFDDIALALKGSFDLHQLFAGPQGIELLTLFFTGAVMKLSFPWPGPTSVKLVGGLMFSFWKQHFPGKANPFAKTIK